MYKNLEVVNNINHKEVFVKQVKELSFAKELINVIISVTEFYESCKDYPIFFAKDKDGSWFASAILGYKEKENLFVKSDNSWEKNRYIPATVRKYPFIFISQPEKNELMLAVDKEYLSVIKEDTSKQLFDKDGNNSEYLNGVLNFLTQFQNDLKATSEFIKQLDEWELLEERTATITTSNNEQYNINGFYVVNEEKLKHLSKKKKEEMTAKEAIPLITAHLISLSNIQKIGNMA